MEGMAFYACLSLAVGVALLFAWLLWSTFHLESSDYSTYREVALARLVAYGFKGSSSCLESTIRLAYANNAAIEDTVVAIAMLMPNLFCRETLRSTFANALLSSTCGDHCDISLKTVKSGHNA